MKKRILATFISLALVLSLSPVHVSALEEPKYVDPSTVTEGVQEIPAEHTEELSTEDVACAGLSSCREDAHDPECPLYTAPASEPTEGTEAKLDTEDLAESKDIQLPEEIPENVRIFLKVAAAVTPEEPETIEAALNAYAELTEDQQVRQDVMDGYAALEKARAQLLSTPNEPSTTEIPIYVSGETGNDLQGTGTPDAPYATLAQAVEQAPDGATIYVMSNLTLTKCARFYNKSLIITSGKGGPYTITREDDFETIQDNARSTYNPAMIEVQATTAGGQYGLTLKNIVLDDSGKHKGTVFAQASSGSDKDQNTKYVQDAIVASNATVPCTITLGDGAVLQNFGGMSAVRITDQAKLVMESGSVIEDTTIADRETGETGSNGPAGAIWIQGAEFIMENGAEVKNVVGRAVYADGGTASIGGTISGIAGDKDMWQGASGVAIHVRGGANVTLTGTVIGITAPNSDNSAIETINSDFEAATGSIISQITNLRAVYAHDQGGNYSHKMLLNGTITDCTTTGSLMRSFYANIAVGPTGVIEQCKATGAGGLLYTHNGSQYTIQGKLIDNTASSIMYLGNWGGGTTYATLEEGGLIANNSNYGVQINGASSGAYFVMNGGEISGNEIGIYMREKVNNHFIMNGGKIINNRSAGISHIFGNSTYIELNGGEIFDNGDGYEISAIIGSANNKKNYLSLKSGVLKGNRCINLSFGKVAMDEGYTDISLGTASSEAFNTIKDAAIGQGDGWTNQSYSALWFKPTTETFHFTTPRPNVDNILYAGYIPLKEDGTPADHAQLNLIQLEGDNATGSVTTTDTLDINLAGLMPNQPYALMLIKSPILIVRPVNLAKYVTGDDKHDGESYINCFPDPRYEGIPKDAQITVSGQVWEPGLHGGAQYPFTIHYYEQDGDQIKDDHAPGTYTAKVEILSGLGAPGNAILINNQRVYFGTGTLSIRTASNATEIENIKEISSPVTTNEPAKPVEQAVAVMPDQVTYLVNGIDGQLPNPDADIRLLQDEVLSAEGQDEDQYVRMMRQRLEKEYNDLVVPSGETPRQYAMKYLDLIDAHDSNLIITPKLGYEEAYHLYLPYPSGTDMQYDFQLFCFEDLDRTYTAKDYGENVENVIQNSTVSKLQVENTEYGLKITIQRNSRLGAMALTWQQKEHTITATAGTGGSISPEGSVKVRHTDSETFSITPDNGYHIADVKVDGISQGAVASYAFDNVTENHTIAATFDRDNSGGGGGGGGSSSVRYTLCYDSNGGTEYRDEEYRRNTVVKLDKTPERKGYTFTGWYADRKLTDKISSIQMTSDKTVYAGWRHDYTPADLNSKDHVSYVSGYPDGTVRPDAPITRAETATMIYRLLTDARRAEIDTEVNSFGDVSSSDWFVRPVSTMVNGGYIVGYPDGTFGGSKQITRAEFVTMLVRFIGLKDAECSFHDVSQNHWAYRFIAMATDAGWIAGYTDGTFAPDQTITRAEAMTILNSVLNRGVNEKSELLNFKVWPDNPQTAWYYYEVIEASNGHEYTGARPSEDWTKLVKDLL